MSKEDIKKELHELIDNTDDVEILNMVKEDIIAYSIKEKEFDLKDLSAEDRAELEKQDVEDPMKDTITYEEHKKNIAEWRLELLQKRDTTIK